MNLGEIKLTSNKEVRELIEREEPLTRVRCWKCLRLIKEGEVLHDCWREAKKFVLRYEGDLRGTMGEFFSAYPLNQSEVERLGGDLESVGDR